MTMKNWLNKIPMVAFVILGWTTFNSALAANVIPQSIMHEEQQYDLCDDYTLRYGFVIKVADIGWYSLDCQNNPSLLATSNKILRFYYHKDVKASFFADSAAEYFLLNLEDSDEVQQLKAQLAEFNAGYTDIKSGEYFDLVHRNDASINLYKNDKFLVASDDPLFARKYFNIWFGNSPVIKKLKQAFSTE